MPNLIWDGHETISGVSGANPTVIPRNFCAESVNRWFRYDTNAPRPGFREIQLTFVDDTDGNNEKLFRAGNVQGGHFYNSYPTFQGAKLIFSIAGTIFTVEIIGNKGYVRKLFTGNDPVFTHAWFAQAMEWLVIQDGTSAPILWNGTAEARRSVEGLVPTGSVMAFIHGRLAVASSDGTNQIAVGNIIYGEDATTTNDVIKFTEKDYWAEGGAFGAPVYVGDIMGMYAMPFLDTGTGQNELVIFGTEGACSMDLSGPRNSWLDASILRISLVGGGCVSSHSLCAMNGDVFFRSSEGIRSYRNARMEFQQSWKQAPISSDVRRWIDYDAPAYLQYNSQTSWNNMLFSTCYPRIAPANNPFAGHHRFHLGFVVMDAWSESNTLSRGSSVWHGVWTGIRPVCFLSGRVIDRDRCFAMSYDCDGRNRIYEITADDKHDTVNGRKIRIRSTYTTGNLGVIERVSNNFEPKKLAGGMIELSQIREEVRLNVRFRPDSNPCFLPMGDEMTVGCECRQGDCSTTPKKPNFTMPLTAKLHLATPSEKACTPGLSNLSKFIYHTQAKIELDGWAVVDRMKLNFFTQKESENVTCKNPNNCQTPVQCCQDEFYCIIEGEGPPAPVIETPSDINLFTATAVVTRACPIGTYGDPVTVQATATSAVSFEDALQKAEAQALTQALARLDCYNCSAEVSAAFIANNDTTDLSGFFDAGSYAPSSADRPWRLIETVTEIEYARGIVDATGALSVIWAPADPNTYFDITTKEFIDTAGTGDLYMALEVGCVPGGVTEWPEHPEYFSP